MCKYTYINTYTYRYTYVHMVVFYTKPKASSTVNVMYRSVYKACLEADALLM